MEVKSTTWPRIYSNSTKCSREKNDCVVRAITETFGIPYDEAHAIAADKFKIKPQRGTMFVYPTFLDLNKAGYKIGDYEIDYVSDWNLTYKGSKSHIGLYDNKDDKNYKITVGMFLRQRPIGRYLVIVKGHAFSIVNGVIIGNKVDGQRLKARVENVIIAETP